ncbi:unnamed protein product, partial [marine sediment metagenome]
NDPREFKKLLELSKVLEGKALKKLIHKIEKLIDEQKTHKFYKQLENYFFDACLPNSNTGFKLPDLTKFTEMVVFFTEKLQPWKTKLNKLLFYTDFSMYKYTGFSISGVQYIAIPMGPVPNNFNSIFDYLANNNAIDIFYTTFPDGGAGEQFLPVNNRKFKPELFTEKELKVLDAIVERFKNTTTNEIIEISHKEKAWIENEAERKIIDYNYSFELN